MALTISATQTWTHQLNKEAERQATLATLLADGSYPCFGANALLQPPETCNNDPELKDAVWPKTRYEDEKVGQLPSWNNQYSGPIPYSYGTESESALRVALVGDSHAFMLGSAILPQIDNLGWQVDTYIGTSCVWQLPNQGGSEVCADLLAGIATEGYDMIITANYVGRDWTQGESAIAASRAAWSEAVANGAQVVVLVDNPQISDETIKYLDQNRSSYRALANISFPISEVLLPDWQIEAATGVPGVTLIDLTEFYCPDGRICPLAIGNVVLYRDPHHISQTYWKTLWPYLLQRLPLK